MIAKLVLAASAASILAAPAVAEAKHRVLVCDRHAVRSKSNTGTLIGAVGGGVLGNAVGGSTTSTVVGAGVGAVAGHEVAKHNAKKKRCHYVYR
jgi:uncharacterized protein YcfJ